MLRARVAGGPSTLDEPYRGELGGPKAYRGAQLASYKVARSITDELAEEVASLVVAREQLGPEERLRILQGEYAAWERSHSELRAKVDEHEEEEGDDEVDELSEEVVAQIVIDAYATASTPDRARCSHAPSRARPALITMALVT